MFSQPRGRPVEILLVEDNVGDADLVREALAQGGIRNNVNVVWDGDEAMAYLRWEGLHADAVKPDFMLLDLKLPRKGGLEVLADEVLRHIPVIVLSSSDAPEDVRRAYDLQASCYVSKPADLDEFERVMQTIRDFRRCGDPKITAMATTILRQSCWRKKWAGPRSPNESATTVDKGWDLAFQPPSSQETLARGEGDVLHEPAMLPTLLPT